MIIDTVYQGCEVVTSGIPQMAIIIGVVIVAVVVSILLVKTALSDVKASDADNKNPLYRGKCEI